MSNGGCCFVFCGFFFLSSQKKFFRKTTQGVWCQTEPLPRRSPAPFPLTSFQVERPMLRYSGLLFLLETYAVDRLSPFSSFLIITPSIGVQAASAQRASWPSVPTLPALLLIYWPLVFPCCFVPVPPPVQRRTKSACVLIILFAVSCQN